MIVTQLAQLAANDTIQLQRASGVFDVTAPARRIQIACDQACLNVLGNVQSALKAHMEIATEETDKLFITRLTEVVSRMEIEITRNIQPNPPEDPATLPHA